MTKWERIADDLAARITSGELATGDPVPSVRSIMATEQVADDTAKRALGHLVAKGLIRSIPQVGYIVIGPDSTAARLDAHDIEIADLRRRLDDAGL